MKGDKQMKKIVLGGFIFVGGALYVAKDARRMLAELTQKERMEGTDYGDGTVEN